jgi:hypothetical protein
MGQRTVLSSEPGVLGSQLAARRPRWGLSFQAESFSWPDQRPEQLGAPCHLRSRLGEGPGATKIEAPAALSPDHQKAMTEIIVFVLT